MIQAIKMEHLFDLEGLNIKDGAQGLSFSPLRPI